MIKKQQRKKKANNFLAKSPKLRSKLESIYD